MATLKHLNLTGNRYDAVSRLCWTYCNGPVLLPHNHFLFSELINDGKDQRLR